MQGLQQPALAGSDTHSGDTLDTEAAGQPLAIVVTSAAIEELALRDLARQALAYLRNPERFTSDQRQELSWSLGRLLDATDADDICEYSAAGDSDLWEGDEPWP